MKELFLVYLLTALVTAHPGLLRIPKVYNAVITSNQNLSPSRAFPVIQPVIHRTSIGYVPPFYYSHVAPHFAGPEVVHLPYGPTKPPSNEDQGKSEGGEAEASASASSSAESSARIEKQRENQEAAEEGEGGEGRKNGENGGANDGGNENGGGNGDKGKKPYGDQVPLSFYPNYHSLYYDPYFYTYNSFNPHLVPGNYYVDYQPYGPIDPIPPIVPKGGYGDRFLPGYYGEKKKNNNNNNNNNNSNNNNDNNNNNGNNREDSGKGEDVDQERKSERQKIPDVPPPPVPTAAPKRP